MKAPPPNLYLLFPKIPPAKQGSKLFAFQIIIIIIVIIVIIIIIIIVIIIITIIIIIIK